jgi:capsular polysaccharide biosynthesis protein
MDLLSIVQTLWRHKLAALPVILLTAVAAFYVTAVKAPTYEATSSFLLVNPPGPPSATQIATHPKLAKVNTGNPYVEYGDLAIVADAVDSVVTSSSAGQALAQEGADPRYQVEVSTDVGNPPIIQITGLGKNPQEAIKSANLVTSAAQNDLYLIQKQEGVNALYMIRPIMLVQPLQASKSVSGNLRTLVAVLAMGAIALFILISVIDAIEKRRMASTDDTQPRSEHVPAANGNKVYADTVSSRRSAVRR